MEQGFGYGTLSVSLSDSAMAGLLVALREDGHDEADLRDLARKEIMSLAVGALESAIYYALDEFLPA